MCDLGTRGTRIATCVVGTRQPWLHRRDRRAHPGGDAMRMSTDRPGARWWVPEDVSDRRVACRDRGMPGLRAVPRRHPRGAGTGSAGRLTDARGGAAGRRRGPGWRTLRGPGRTAPGPRPRRRGRAARVGVRHQRRQALPLVGHAWQTKDTPVPEPRARGRVRSVAGRRAQPGATARHRPAGRDGRQGSLRCGVPGGGVPGPDGRLASRLPGRHDTHAGPGLGVAHAASGGGPALAEAGRGLRHARRRPDPGALRACTR